MLLKFELQKGVVIGGLGLGAASGPEALAASIVGVVIGASGTTLRPDKELVKAFGASDIGG